MATHAEVHLGQRTDAKELRDVDQERNLHAVVRFEENRVESRTSKRRLASERLADLAESGVEQREDGPCREFVHPSAPRRHVVQGTLVKALDQLNGRSLEEWLEQTGHVVRGGIEHVGVEKDDDRRGTGGEAEAHRRALAADSFQMHHARAVMVGHGCGVVTGVIVHHHEFVDELIVYLHGVQNGADGRGLVPRRDDHRDGHVALELGHAFK